MCSIHDAENQTKHTSVSKVDLVQINSAAKKINKSVKNINLCCRTHFLCAPFLHIDPLIPVNNCRGERQTRSAHVYLTDVNGCDTE